jgi:hypothetical protein
LEASRRRVMISSSVRETSSPDLETSAPLFGTGVEDLNNFVSPTAVRGQTGCERSPVVTPARSGAPSPNHPARASPKVPWVAPVRHRARWMAILQLRSDGRGSSVQALDDTDPSHGNVGEEIVGQETPFRHMSIVEHY